MRETGVTSPQMQKLKRGEERTYEELMATPQAEQTDFYTNQFSDLPTLEHLIEEGEQKAKSPRGRIQALVRNVGAYARGEKSFFGSRAETKPTTEKALTQEEKLLQKVAERAIGYKLKDHISSLVDGYSMFSVDEVRAIFAATPNKFWLNIVNQKSDYLQMNSDVRAIHNYLSGDYGQASGEEVQQREVLVTQLLNEKLIEKAHRRERSYEGDKYLIDKAQTVEELLSFFPLYETGLYVSSNDANEVNIDTYVLRLNFGDYMNSFKGVNFAADILVQAMNTAMTRPLYKRFLKKLKKLAENGEYKGRKVRFVFE